MTFFILINFDPKPYIEIFAAFFVKMLLYDFYHLLSQN